MHPQCHCNSETLIADRIICIEAPKWQGKVLKSYDVKLGELVRGTGSRKQKQAILMQITFITQIKFFKHSRQHLDDKRLHVWECRKLGRTCYMHVDWGNTHTQHFRTADSRSIE